jgi:hypothetical protein
MSQKTTRWLCQNRIESAGYAMVFVASFARFYFCPGAEVTWMPQQQTCGLAFSNYPS